MVEVVEVVGAGRKEKNKNNNNGIDAYFLLLLSTWTPACAQTSWRLSMP